VARYAHHIFHAQDVTIGWTEMLGVEGGWNCRMNLRSDLKRVLLGQTVVFVDVPVKTYEQRETETADFS